MKKIIALILISLFFISNTWTALANNEDAGVFDNEFDVTLFYSITCPHCHKEIEFLSKLGNKYPDLKIRYLEVTSDAYNLELLMKFQEELEINSNGVPITIIGDEFIVGYGDDSSTGLQIISKLEKNGYVFSKNEKADLNNQELNDEKESDYIKAPFFGRINYGEISLPVLSVGLGILDGFNPCAMWVLIFLIGLLMGMKDRRKMWILGGAFIFSSSVVYFFFMTAWLNLFLFLEAVKWVRITIAIVALASGVYYFYDYYSNPEGACKVSGGDKKQKVFSRLKELILERGFWISFFGIIVLAAAVNLVELICSAGLPAVFTKVLTMSELPLWQYYSYILVYLFFFMLDDIVVFTIAMITMKSVNISGKYSRYSRLIGGLLMLILGVLLAFKPEWLMF